MSIAESVTTDPITPRRKMTIDEFLALPEDGIDRMLLDGEVWEVGMTVRDHLHAEVAANVTGLLLAWIKAKPKPRGKVAVGDAGFRLIPGEASVVGPDIAFASAELVARTTEEITYYEGPPVLAVEILSPSDTHEDLIAKVRKYLQAGVVIWQVNPNFQVVRVYRPGMPVESYNATMELVADPYLPGFRVAVAEFFAD